MFLTFLSERIKTKGLGSDSGVVQAQEIPVIINLVGCQGGGPVNEPGDKKN